MRTPFNTSGARAESSAIGEGRPDAGADGRTPAPVNRGLESIPEWPHAYGWSAEERLAELLEMQSRGLPMIVRANAPRTSRFARIGGNVFAFVRELSAEQVEEIFGRRVNRSPGGHFYEVTTD